MIQVSKSYMYIPFWINNDDLSHSMAMLQWIMQDCSNSIANTMELPWSCIRECVDICSSPSVLCPEYLCDRELEMTIHFLIGICNRQFYGECQTTTREEVLTSRKLVIVIMSCVFSAVWVSNGNQITIDTFKLKIFTFITCSKMLL